MPQSYFIDWYVLYENIFFDDICMKVDCDILDD